MPRLRVISRSIKATEVTCLMCDVESAELFNKTVTIPSTFTDTTKLEKAVRSIVSEPTKKFVDIVKTEEHSSVYAMTEQQFIETAKKFANRSEITAIAFGMDGEIEEENTTEN